MPALILPHLLIAPTRNERTLSGMALRQSAKVAPLAKLKLTVHAQVGRRYVSFLRPHLVASHRILDHTLIDLSLALVGDERMSSLHKQFMNIDGPTDVLTFPLEFDCDGHATAGEVVICVPEAARQARLRKTRIECELLLYALHGMLHLSGFDDRTESGFRLMHRKEDEILTALGLGPVFGTDGPAVGRNRRGKPTRSNNRTFGKRRGNKPRRARAIDSAGV